MLWAHIISNSSPQIFELASLTGPATATFVYNYIQSKLCNKYIIFLIINCYNFDLL